MENTLIMMKLEYLYEEAGSIMGNDQEDGIVVVKRTCYQWKIHKIQVSLPHTMSGRWLMADNDISGGSFGIRQVRLTLNGAFNMLQEQLCQRAKEMVENKDWHRAGEDDPEELSILGKVMGVTREVKYYA